MQNKAILQSLGLSNDVIYQTGFDILQNIENRGSLLDFGAGRGKFLEIISALKFKNCTGADLMDRPTSLPSSTEWIQADLNGSLNLEKESFDLITAIEVIEHLENPRAMIREFYRLLKPGGYILVSTPNNESIRAILALWFRGHFVSFLSKDYPAHITALTSLDLQRIFTENNFSSKFYFTNTGMAPGLKGITWQDISFQFLKGKRYSDNVFILGRKQ